MSGSRKIAVSGTGTKALSLEWVLANPWTRSIDQAKGVVDDLLALPFNGELAAHFR